MERRFCERSQAGDGGRAPTASTAQHHRRVAARARSIICLAVCSGSLLLASPAHAAGAHGRAGILAERADLDSKLQTALIDQPRWLRGVTDEREDAAGSLRLFLTTRGRQAPASENAEARVIPTTLGARDFSFPVRKVAAEHLVTRSVMLKLSVGLDRELENWAIGEITPSVGLQFERRFQ